MSNMTQPGYDERYAMPIEASRRGAHRARPNPLLGILPIVGVAVVVAAVVLLAFTLFGSGGGSDSASSGSDPTGGTSAAASVEASDPAATGDPAATPEASEPAAQPSQDAAGEATPQPSANAGAGKVDKTIVLNFYNATDPVVEGLSRKAAAKLVAQGWKQGSVASWTGVPVTETTVFYNKPAQKATAEAIAAVLGVGTVKQAQRPQKQILVVVYNDYTP